MARLVRFPSSVMAAIVTVGLPLAAVAEQKAWDQAAVTRLAQQLADACDDWRTAIVEKVPDTEGTSSAFPDDQMLRRSVTLLEMSKGLADYLEKGDGLDKTKEMFLNFKEVFDDNVVSIERALVDQPTQQAWNKVVVPATALWPYYSSQPLTMP